MDNLIRVYGYISPQHEADFMLIKGVYGCRNNGDVLAKMIELVAPGARRLASKKRQR